MKQDGRSRYRGFTKRTVSGGKQPVTIYLTPDEADKLDAIARGNGQAVGALAKDIVSTSLRRRK